MKFFFVTTTLLMLGLHANAQTFPVGTNAIHKDSSIIVSWAVSAHVERGYINIADTSLTYSEGGTTSNKAFHGVPQNALGPADGNFVSLGDGGYAILQFEIAIKNGPGPDFAVFENAIFSPPTQTNTAFIELAFVELSTNGIDWERFPAVSNCQYEQQNGSFSSVDRNLFHNFAGIYPVFFGVPFDIDDLPGLTVDKNNINLVKIIDAIGNINPEYATYDANGNIVNDAWPTPFATCGFDLDAVGVIHISQNNTLALKSEPKIYPNPAKSQISISGIEVADYTIMDNSGKVLIAEKEYTSEKSICISKLGAGLYIIKILSEQKTFTKKLIVID